MATYSDDFNRTDSGANAGWGANWQHYTSGSASNTGWEILSNQGRVNASFTARAALWNGGSVTADQNSRVAIASLSVDGHAYAVVRGTDDQNLYRGGFLNSSTVRISKLVAGASTTIGTQSVTFSAGDVVELRVVGSSLSLYVNDVLQIGPTTDTEYSSGRPGVAVQNTSDFDNWSGGDYGSSSTYPVNIICSRQGVALATARNRF